MIIQTVISKAAEYKVASISSTDGYRGDESLTPTGCQTIIGLLSGCATL